MSFVVFHVQQSPKPLESSNKEVTMCTNLIDHSEKKDESSQNNNNNDKGKMTTATVTIEDTNRQNTDGCQDNMINLQKDTDTSKKPQSCDDCQQPLGPQQQSKTETRLTQKKEQSKLLTPDKKRAENILTVALPLTVSTQIMICMRVEIVSLVNLCVVV